MNGQLKLGDEVTVLFPPGENADCQQALFARVIAVPGQTIDMGRTEARDPYVLAENEYDLVIGNDHCRCVYKRENILKLEEDNDHFLKEGWFVSTQIGDQFQVGTIEKSGDRKSLVSFTSDKDQVWFMWINNDKLEVNHE